MNTLTVETSTEYNARLAAIYANVYDDVYVEELDSWLDEGDQERDSIDEELPDYM